MIRAYTSNQNNVQVGPHFKVKEFACKDGSSITFIDDYMVTILELLRKELGDKPIIITSGYRTPAHNAPPSRQLKSLISPLFFPSCLIISTSILYSSLAKT